jgi:hypothetical protein
MDQIAKVDHGASIIIDTRKPIGLFYIEEPGCKYTGIDNSTGEVWVEEFTKLLLCLKWLNGEFEIGDEQEWSTRKKFSLELQNNVIVAKLRFFRMATIFIQAVHLLRVMSVKAVNFMKKT